jgi:hypothetical protein
MVWDSKTPVSITMARLMNSPPLDVYRELKDSELDRDSYWYRDANIEEALLGRNDLLITLGLAQYCTSLKVGKELYKRGTSATGDPTYSKALRIAVLSNSVLLRSNILSTTLGAIPDEEVLRLINTDDENETDELHSMVRNSGAKAFLDRLYNAEKPFDDIPEDKYVRAVFWSHTNPAINDDHSDVHGPDMYAWGIHKGIKRLMQMLPVTEFGLLAAYWLLRSADRGHTGSFDEDPAPVFKRWQPLELSDNFKKYHEGDAGLDLKEEFLCMLAAVYGHYSTKTPDNKFQIIYMGSADSPDLLLRCAHYSHDRKLTPEWVRKAHDRDGDAFLVAALYNDALFWNVNTRAVLEELIHGRLVHRYRQRCEQLKKRWPQFDLKPVSEQGLALLEDEDQQQNEDQKRLERLEALLTANAKQVQRLYTVLSWVLVLVIIAVLMIWKPHFL